MERHNIPGCRVTRGTKDLFRAADRGDFNASSSVLLDLCTRGIDETELDDFSTHETKPTTSLRVRDHVFQFLGLTPFYCAIQDHSANVLSRFSGMDDIEDIRQTAFDWLEQLLVSPTDQLSFRYLDTDRILNNRYAVHLPAILNKKNSELKDCRIEFIHDRSRLFYSLENLDRTSYGHLLLMGLTENTSRIEYPNIIVQDAEWASIKEALKEMGLEPDAMLTEVGWEKWRKFERDTLGFRRKLHPSPEVQSIRELHDAGIALSIAFDDNIVRRIGMYQSNYHNRLLMDRAKASWGTVRSVVVEALVASGDTSILDFLSSLIKFGDKTSKLAIAKGISTITSAMSGFQHTAPVKTNITRDAVDMTEAISALGEYSRHRLTVTRLEALDALAEIQDIRAYNLIKNAIANDQASRVRLKAVELTSRLPREIASEILRIGLEDSNYVVAFEAEKKVLELGWEFE